MKVDSVSTAHNKPAIKKQPSFKCDWGESPKPSRPVYPGGGSSESRCIRSKCVNVAEALKSELQYRINSLKAQQEMRANQVSPVLLRVNNNLKRVIK